MPRKPDIAMRRRRTVVFVNGCFWHRREGCRCATTPGSNAEYWRRKFERTVARDRESQEAPGRDSWKVLVIWERQTRDGAKLANMLAEILPPRG